MKKILFTGILVSLLASCSTSTDQVSNAENKAQTDTLSEDELVAVIPNRKMTTEIDGMTCVMGCGGSIRKELLGTGAVARCSFDFKGMDETSKAMIEFDKDKISADEIADLIKDINEGQFTLGKMSTETIATEVEEESNADEASTTEEKKITPIHVSSSSGIQLPNFIDLISELLVH
ncbi:MAG: heavy-metal-associated domain-containing protein [Crocinitomicaceae bacterium]